MNLKIALEYPAKGQEFKDENREMFNGISSTYDFLNHVLSFGIDVLWRKKAIRILGKNHPKRILDVATGTADFAIEALSLNPNKVIGIDVSSGMLELGKEKIKRRNLESKIELLLGDSENIPFQDNEFDALSVAFGVRNFGDLNKGLSEMRRVMKPDGTLVVLEFSKPKGFIIKGLYGIYFGKILPLAGRLISGHSTAYTYLHNSVNRFPEGEEFIRILKNIGFKNTSMKRLSFGVATIYSAQK